MPSCPPRGITSQKQQNFPPFEFRWSLRCEDKRDSAVCFNGGKMLDLFFFSRRMFGIRCYLNLVLHTAAEERHRSGRAHNRTGLSACVISGSRGRGPGSQKVFRCHKLQLRWGFNVRWWYGGHALCLKGSIHFHFFSHTKTPFSQAVFCLLMEFGAFRSTVTARQEHTSKSDQRAVISWNMPLRSAHSYQQFRGPNGNRDVVKGEFLLFFFVTARWKGIKYLPR